MIVGIGIDIVHVERIISLWNRHRPRLCRSVFTSAELDGCKISGDSPERLTARQARFLAERFAGKEAVIKAMGLGPEVRFEFTDIGIHGAQAVWVDLGGRLKEIAARQGIVRLHGSCSSSQHTTVACIIGESTDG